MNHAPKFDLDAALREVLKPAPAPEALRSELLARAGRRARPWPPFRTSLLAAAAVVILGLGAQMTSRMNGEGKGSKHLVTAVSEASQEFVDPRDLAFKEESCAGKGCGEWAQVRAGFRAPLPACIAETDLAGGGTCRIAGGPTVHYSLRDGRKVYVFPKELEACRAGRRVVMDRGALQAQAWNEQGRGYLLLALK